jgi:glycosyltransferase involved in cell wall biosynthesis
VARKIWFQAISLRCAAEADVIVNHGRLDYLEAIYRTRKPVIHWFHCPLTGREIRFVRQRRQRGDIFVAISQSQIENDPEAGRFKVVYNPVNVDSIPFSAKPADPPYLLFLGRLTENKGTHVAIEVAKLAGMKLAMGGIVPNEPGAREYYETRVKPHLGPSCEWVGPYNDAMRLELVAGASALLFPIQWPEPFGLVMVEAMAGGVPVVARRYASTPEVVEDGRTGFLCDSVNEMVAAVGRIGAISRAECRRSMERRFSLEMHLDRLEELLEEARGL